MGCAASTISAATVTPCNDFPRDKADTTKSARRQKNARRRRQRQQADHQVKFLVVDDNSSSDEKMSCSPTTSTAFMQLLTKGIEAKFPSEHAGITTTPNRTITFHLNRTDYEFNFVTSRDVLLRPRASFLEYDVLIYTVSLAAYNEITTVDDDNNNKKSANQLALALERLRILYKSTKELLHTPIMIFFLDKNEFQQMALNDPVTKHTFFREYLGHPHDYQSVIHFLGMRFLECANIGGSLLRSPFCHVVENPESLLCALLDQTEVIIMSKELIQSGFILIGDVPLPSISRHGSVALFR